MGDAYEKPSRHKQWQERSERPIAARPMTTREIEEYRGYLVQSYQCDDTDITYEFYKIKDDDDDEDRDDCLLLKYRQRCQTLEGVIKQRDIFTIKLPIPDSVRYKAEQLNRNKANRAPVARRVMKALPAPVVEPLPQPTQQPTIESLPDVVSQHTDQSDQKPLPVQDQRPKLRKPVRVAKK